MAIFIHGIYVSLSSVIAVSANLCFKFVLTIKINLFFASCFYLAARSKAWQFIF